MRLTTYLPTATALFALVHSTTAATIPIPPVESAKLATNEQTRVDCYLLAPYRRQACLRSLTNPRRNVVAVSDAGSSLDVAAVKAVAAAESAAASPADAGVAAALRDVVAERDVSSDLGEHVELGGDGGGEDGKARLIHKKPVVHPTGVFLPISTFVAGAPTFMRITHLNDPAITSEDGKMHYTIGKRDIAVTAAAEAGAIDLAIPVDLAPATSPVPTTLRTITTATAAPSRLDPITVDEALTMGTSTYPVHRTLQTATLANGTEIRIEQTESQVHDVHIEETEHEKDEPEQDKVIVHVKVFVEHVKEAAARVKRAMLPVLEKRDVEVEEKGQVESEVGEGREWGCYCKWYGCFCGYHGKDKEDGWTK